MFIVDPSNIDYLIEDVRFHVGDSDSKKYSDIIVRTSILNGIKMLQRRWGYRYLVYNDDLVTETDDTLSGYVYVKLPGTYEEPNRYDYVPSGYVNNDVFRNPDHMFTTNTAYIISSEDEFPVILASSISLMRAHMTSSADTYQSWSDGEFSFSNLGASRALQSMYTQDTELLNLYLKKRLAGASTKDFEVSYYITRR